MHTLTEICFDLNIAKGSKSRSVLAFKRDYNIIGVKDYFEGQKWKSWLYTDEQYKILLEEYPKHNKKGVRPKVNKTKNIPIPYLEMKSNISKSGMKARCNTMRIEPELRMAIGYKKLVLCVSEEDMNKLLYICPNPGKFVSVEEAIKEIGCSNQFMINKLVDIPVRHFIIDNVKSRYLTVEEYKSIKKGFRPDTGTGKNTNHDNGFYNTIQPYFLINCFQGER